MANTWDMPVLWNKMKALIFDFEENLKTVNFFIKRYLIIKEQNKFWKVMPITNQYWLKVCILEYMYMPWFSCKKVFYVARTNGFRSKGHRTTSSSEISN